LTEDNEGSTFVWSVTGGEITIGAGTNMITVLWGDPGMGYVNVTETSIYGCEQITEDFEVTVDDCTDIGEIETNQEITYSIHNNLVSITSPTEITDVTVFDITGKKIISKTNLDKYQVQVNLNKNRDGLYIFLVKGETFTETIKIIK
jgi:hypothetical protein